MIVVVLFRRLESLDDAVFVGLRRLDS